MAEYVEEDTLSTPHGSEDSSAVLPPSPFLSLSPLTLSIPPFPPSLFPLKAVFLFLFLFFFSIRFSYEEDGIIVLKKVNPDSPIHV